MDGQYEEAILAFDKAIKIESKATEVRVYQVKAYIGNEELDKAVEVLEETQNIDITNEELLKEILDILNEIDTDISYEFLDRFMQEVGENNISQDIRDILDTAYENPQYPTVDPEPGTYLSAIVVKIKQDKTKYKILETAAELYVTDHKNAIYNKLNSASKCYISLNLLDTLDENKQNSNGEDFNGVIVFTKPNQYEYKEDYAEIISCT